MMTLRQFSERLAAIPTATSWYLTDLGRAQGKQELFTRQSPQKLKALRDQAMIESTISSNRIEGVEVDRDRIGTLVFGKPALRDRDEEEVRGYRDALRWIHEQGSEIPFNERTILDVHRLSRGEVWDAGRYKGQPVDIIEKHPDGRQSVRFRSLAPEKTPEAVKEMIELKTAYTDFEQRIGSMKNGRGEKTERIIAAIRAHFGPFSVGEIQSSCPGVSLDLIRRTLKKLRVEGKVRCLGRGQNARWEASNELDNT